MKFVSTCHVDNVGDFEYYISKTNHETEDGIVTTYGIAVKDVLKCQTEEVQDIWDDENEILDFINVLCNEQVTLINFKEICEEFVEELYSI